MDRRTLFGLAAVAALPTRASSSEGAVAPAETYFRLPIVTAAIIHADGRRGVLSIETGVDATDAALRLRAQQSIPRLRAAYNAAAQRFASGLRPGAVPNIDQLANDLQAATNATLGRAGARVLLGTVMAV